MRDRVRRREAGTVFRHLPIVNFIEQRSWLVAGTVSDKATRVGFGVTRGRRLAARKAVW